MSIANMPGFSAEASLRKATHRFQSIGPFAQSNTLIYPAQGFVFLPGDLDTKPSMTFGTVTPINEGAFNTYVTSCVARGARTSDCWRTCCRQITGLQTRVIA